LSAGENALWQRSAAGDGQALSRLTGYYCTPIAAIRVPPTEDARGVCFELEAGRRYDAKLKDRDKRTEP
jgi:hypothetical protein